MPSVGVTRSARDSGGKLHRTGHDRSDGDHGAVRAKHGAVCGGESTKDLLPELLGFDGRPGTVRKGFGEGFENP